ncbi:hypothetical protein [Altererythrobacter sp. ZODW24]|uniref:tetratricopeptide repeat protein n=1 Tax=Altererythrobacter sp. ZODW24 TaxID=2185142 RepID=UPI000DF74730|nr:hypothetical protein [Altererythrobacter sp. ZODW24]
MRNLIGRTGLSSLAALAILGSATVATAQENTSLRVDKLESEVRALQRKVFPGGAGRFFEPEIGSSQSTQTPIAGSTTAVTDILVRLDALESQMQRLTSQTEENTNGIAMLSARIGALETPSGTFQPAISPAAGNPSAATPTPTPAPAPAQSGPTDARIAAVSAIAKPSTDDAADDEYSYGYRLWNAGFLPEAQQQLRIFLDRHPSHWRTTYGRNLLGRAYLDDGKARDAAPWFLQNYQADKTGARAGDSLLYLAETMIALEDTGRACIALAEFGDTYPALATGRLQSRYAAQTAKVSCN